MCQLVLEDTHNCAQNIFHKYLFSSYIKARIINRLRFILHKNFSFFQLYSAFYKQVIISISYSVTYHFKDIFQKLN